MSGIDSASTTGSFQQKVRVMVAARELLQAWPERIPQRHHEVVFTGNSNEVVEV